MTELLVIEVVDLDLCFSFGLTGANPIDFKVNMYKYTTRNSIHT
jgi:hypothetical protein